MSTGENGRIAALIGVKVICCAGLVLAATGALTGVGTWLAEGGLVWLGAGGLVMATGLIAWWRWKRSGQARPKRPLTGADNV